MGSKNAEPGTPVPVHAFSAQWNDPKVSRELRFLGFETPAQLGSLFIADAKLLNDLTTGVLPVTDNHPQRLSPRLTVGRSRHQLYHRLMDENERVKRFRGSEFTKRHWPSEIQEASETFFPYERMIKNHFTMGLYRESVDPYPWEAVDDVLSNTELETLPLWLLGSDGQRQQVIDALLQTGVQGYEDDIELHLAIRYFAKRDYPAALEQIRNRVQGREDPSAGEYSLYLYLLAKNNLLVEAGSVVQGMSPEERESAEIQTFLKWLSDKFGEIPAINTSSVAP